MHYHDNHLPRRTGPFGDAPPRGAWPDNLRVPVSTKTQYLDRTSRLVTGGSQPAHELGTLPATWRTPGVQNGRDFRLRTSHATRVS